MFAVELRGEEISIAALTQSLDLVAWWWRMPEAATLMMPRTTRAMAMLSDPCR
jgi:hypothetical protein